MEEKYGLEKLYFLKREINISANKISLSQGQSYTERKYLLAAILRFAWTSAFKQFFLVIQCKICNENDNEKVAWSDMTISCYII